MFHWTAEQSRRKLGGKQFPNQQIVYTFHLKCFLFIKPLVFATFGKICEGYTELWWEQKSLIKEIEPDDMKIQLMNRDHKNIQRNYVFISERQSQKRQKNAHKKIAY